MATKPKRICQRCLMIVDGKCPRCSVKRDTRDATERHRRAVAYGRKWKAFRLRYLTEHPLCVDCAGQGRVKAATDVHHKRKVKDAPELQYDHENLMALCGECHDVRTGRGE